MKKCCCKKVIYILLMVMLLALSATGCGEKGKADENSKRRNEKLEKDEEETENTEFADDELPYIVTEKDTETEDEVEQETKKWKYKYKNFFEEYGPVLKENIVVNGDAVLDGIKFTLDYACTDEAKSMAITCGDKLCELYSVSETNALFFQCNFDDEWVKVYASMDADYSYDIGQLFWPEVMLGQTNDIFYRRYLKEVEKDGVIYDVLKGVATGSNPEASYYVECYINRETQELSKMDVMFDNADVLHWEFQYPDEGMIRETVESTASTIYKNGEEVSVDKLRNTYADFLDSVTGAKESDTSDKGKETDWDSYYESYFDKQFTLPDSYGIRMIMDRYGTEFDFDGIVTNDEVWIRFSANEAIVDAYLSEQKILIGSSSGWVCAYPDAKEQVESFISIDLWKELGNQASLLTYIAYCGTEEINKTTYDVIEIEFADSTSGKAYINRKNQSVYKLATMQYNKTGIEWLFEDYGKIKIPKEAKNAEEMSVDELTDYYMVLLEDALKS